MKILVIPRWYPTLQNNNSGIFFEVQNKLLINNGVEVSVIYTEITSIKDYYFGKKFKNKIRKNNLVYANMISVPRLIPKSMNHLSALHYIFTNLMFKKYVRQFGKPDIIQAHVTKISGETAVKLGKRYNIPVVITEHHSNTVIVSKNMNETIEDADCFVCVSSYLKDKIGDKDTVVIPNFISDRKVVVHKDKNLFKIITVSSMTENKNTMLLLKAISRLKSYDNIELSIIGDGPQYKTILEFIKKNNLKNVKILGNIANDKVIYEIAKSDVLVSTSYIETFGVSILEAISQGVPVIATNSGGPIDIINNINGIILEGFCEKELADKIIEIKNKKIIFDETKIRKDYISRFSSSVTVKKYINLYNSILINQRVDKH